MPKTNITTSKLEAMLVEGLKADQNFQEQLKALKDAHLKQLQETQRWQCEELEKRIYRNSLLSPDKMDKSEEHHNLVTNVNQSSLRRSCSTSSLVSFPARVTFLTGAPPSAAHPVRPTPASTTQPSQVHKDLESEAECKKKFRATPVPSHVGQPLYHQMTRLREARRKQGLDLRKDFLLSTQRPFSFQERERERERREKLMAMLSQVSLEQTSKQRKAKPSTAPADTDASVKEVTAPEVPLPDKEEELSKKKKSTPHRDTDKSATAPHNTRTPQTSASKPRCSEQTTKRMLAFLDEKPSFKPRISQQVPDFNARHRAFQKELLRKSGTKDSTKCQPFLLRTSSLSLRQSVAKIANSQEPEVGNRLRKSKSFGCLSSLSTETLPTYISDATRKRGAAIRKTLEMKENKTRESVEWMRSFQMRSQAMQKNVTVRAKVTDPHSSLKDVSHGQLRRHREADQQRVKEYLKELQDMKERVSKRPYLFEQMKQKHAKAQVEETYRKKLQEAGLNERFIEATS